MKIAVAYFVSLLWCFRSSDMWQQTAQVFQASQACMHGLQGIAASKGRGKRSKRFNTINGTYSFGLRIGLAGLGGLGVGYAMGSHFGHYRQGGAMAKRNAGRSAI